METPPSDVTVDPAQAVEPSPAVAQAVEPSPAPSGPRRRGRLVEWIWRGRALTEAREADDSAVDRPQVRLVCEIVEVADRLSGAIDPPREGSGYGASILLYRQALEGAIRALNDGSVEEARSTPELLKALFAGNGTEAEALAASGASLLAQDVSAVSHMPEAERRREAEDARRLLHATIHALAGATMRRRRVLAQRLVRTGFVGLVFSALVVGAVLLVVRLLQHPNLLERATIRPSSEYPGFSRETHICDGRRTQLLFHTNKEDHPSVEFDMGVAKTVQYIELVNRHDCCEDRALPLAVDVSADGKEWKEVLRRTDPFSEFRQKIGPVYVRAVRVRALKKTWLHLERVAAW